MSLSIDTIIVISYFIILFTSSVYLSFKNKNSSIEEYTTGGHYLNWKQTGLTLIAMMFDPGVMGNTALAFLWGMYVVQWNAVNVWLTSWVAGMFFIGIYWRTKIVTTPEYLEKRFNAATRGVFSILMVVMLLSFLSFGIYNGGILLNKCFGWNIWVSMVLISGIAGFYVITGGVKTMLTLDIVQGILLLVTMFAVGITGFILVGGFPGLKEMTVIGKAGIPLNSLIPPLDLNPFTEALYPLPSIFLFCTVAGLSFIICNFSMAQRLLASKDESHAQKALIVAGSFNVFTLMFAYIAGVAVRKLMPETNPDESFMTLLLTQFPAGIRGLLVVGLMAALLSTIDGLIVSSATLLNSDIYQRFINKNATNQQVKLISRILKFVIIILVVYSTNIYLDEGNVSQEKSAYEILLEFLGSIMGVLIAVFLLGIFFKRSTAKATFIAALTGVVAGVFLLNATALNFAYAGSIQFFIVLFLGLGLSFFEKPRSIQELENLTIWTVSGVKGPWIGLHSWPALKWWAIGLPLFWIVITGVWEAYLNW